MRKTTMISRLLSLMLCLCMVLSVLPAQVLAYDVCEHGLGCDICPVQALVDALPDSVTAENLAEVSEQLSAID